MHYFEIKESEILFAFSYLYKVHMIITDYRGGRGLGSDRWLEPPFLLKINAFEFELIVGPPFKIAGFAPDLNTSSTKHQYITHKHIAGLIMLIFCRCVRGLVGYKSLINLFLDQKVFHHSEISVCLI